MLSQPASTDLRPDMTSAELKQAIKSLDQYLQDNIFQSAINDTLNKRSHFFDALLCQLWQPFELDPARISLNAVGGYGRQTLHPFSDIDICVIHDGPLTPTEAASVSQFLTQLWDLNLDLGHAVRSLTDTFQACKDDVTIATSLLEIRHLFGNSQHQQQVLNALYGQDLWQSQAFFNAKLSEQQERHAKAQGTSYSIEPNLKTSPGGMRDIQTLTWVARKHFSVANMQSLRSFGFLTNDEYAELMECQHFLFRVRFALHQAAQRSENRLLLQYQAEVAKLMGFGDGMAIGESGNIAIEKMMRQLFRAMKRIGELNKILMAYFQREIIPELNPQIIAINDNFEIVDKYIHVRDETVFIDRTQIMALFEFIAIHHDKIIGITAETLRSLRQVRRRLMGDLQDFQRCREQFKAIFVHPQGMGLAITLMHQHGILASYLPQWREVVGQMQFDLFHAYTVDEHTHKVLKNIYIYGNDIKTLDKDLALAADIYQKMSNKSTLLFAALFHDLAKGRGGDHSKLGAVDANLFAKFHGLKVSQEKLICWLVENHLLMSITSQRMDIYDPEVVNAFAKKVGTLTRLDALYCLTIADIQATNDDLWNDWKASLLKDLYFVTRKALRNGFENILQLRTLVREHKQEALNLLAADDDSSDEIKKLWRRLPIAFFSNAEADDIARYTQAMINHDLTPVAENQYNTLILLDDVVVKGCSDVFVYTKDRHGLFVKLFNTLATLRISVKQAQIARTKDGYVVESFKVLDFDEKPITSAQRREQVIDKLHQVLDKGVNLPKKRQSRRHQSFDNQPNIEFLHSRKSTRSLVNVSALDTSEFMEQIASAFRELDLNIHSATISTVGERADNVFLLSNKDDQQLTPEQQQQLSATLMQAITTDE
ncbi:MULTISPECIES: [protein-PII] uridylyltransferase [Shewanella]|uniref:Bifunctional uridylyltransferase/uridylyl-removing enzyme n=1 Tax=Shewanella frigidimarina (strain NCIMB 400) TaxID=318167 RepID=Q086Q2_SHEFN|nr:MULTISPECIES: [protein-PII] uridylyltransferase [Shewanella]ABI70763.1 UTP-GlnB uridylyltransferase, GlnD [Shewanella frigidimarina NCIMB 400]PKI05314.1 [protein-PII] uridylyltransferase [Shewanella sp. 11B5]